MGIEDSDSCEEALPAKERGFAFDPQMSPERKKQKEEEREIKHKEIQKRSQPKELWCSCSNCIELSPLENICCNEDEFVQKIITAENLKCITEHEGFEPITLNIHVLKTLKVRLLKFVSDDEEKQKKLKAETNETFRFLAYSNFRHWVCGGKKLGRGYRLQTPPCVVKLIREKWPSESGIYTGFVSTLNSLDDL